jgi:sortase A
MRYFLRCTEGVFWCAGVLAISYFVFTSTSARVFQAHQAKRLQVLKAASPQTRPRLGDPFGKISIPRIGVSAIVEEGVDDSTLRRAVGHFPDSHAPGDEGTVALAGHRDTFFRGLARVRLNDLIVLETARGTYKYEVVHTSVVEPTDTQVLRSSPQSDLTLVTCFPFRYIGPAPRRFIVQSRRIDLSSVDISALNQQQSPAAARLKDMRAYRGIMGSHGLSDLLTIPNLKIGEALFAHIRE